MKITRKQLRKLIAESSKWDMDISQILYNSHNLRYDTSIEDEILCTTLKRGDCYVFDIVHKTNPTYCPKITDYIKAGELTYQQALNAVAEIMHDMAKDGILNYYGDDRFTLTEKGTKIAQALGPCP